IEKLETLVSARTKLIIICNPNNPTGARFGADDLDRIAAVAARHGAWILSDEIYRGAELDGHETPSMWGRHDQVIVTSGLSTAYGRRRASCSSRAITSGWMGTSASDSAIRLPVCAKDFSGWIRCSQRLPIDRG